MNKISGTRALTYIDIRAPTLRDTKFVSISCWESGIEPIGGGMQAASLTLKATEGMYEGREFFFRLDLPFRFKDSVPQSVADRQPSKRQRLLCQSTHALFVEILVPKALSYPWY